MIDYQTIREKVATYIRNEILQARLKPGDFIREQEIADELLISRGPVRESLRQLEQEGLVQYHRNRGCVVSKFENEDAAEVFYLRSMFEIGSIELCPNGLPDDILCQMEDVVNCMKGNDECNGVSQFVEQDQLFHSLIARACGLKRLYTMWNSLTPVNIALFLSDGRAKFSLDEQYKRHEKVLTALKSNDMQKAGLMISEHYTRNSALFKQY